MVEADGKVQILSMFLKNQVITQAILAVGRVGSSDVGYLVLGVPTKSRSLNKSKT